MELTGIWALSPLGGMIGLTILMYWGLSSGRVITRGSHERELAMSSKRGDEWKETAEQVRAVNTEIRQQNTKLIEANQIVESLIRAASPSSMADTFNNPRGGG